MLSSCEGKIMDSVGRDWRWDGFSAPAGYGVAGTICG